MNQTSMPVKQAMLTGAMLVHTSTNSCNQATDRYRRGDRNCHIALGERWRLQRAAPPLFLAVWFVRRGNTRTSVCQHVDDDLNADSLSRRIFMRIRHKNSIISTAANASIASPSKMKLQIASLHVILSRDFAASHLVGHTCDRTNKQTHFPSESFQSLAYRPVSVALHFAIKYS